MEPPKGTRVQQAMGRLSRMTKEKYSISWQVTWDTIPTMLQKFGVSSAVYKRLQSKRFFLSLQKVTHKL
jgi:predicted 3-demethylubiquinone-9 3-methyltransferase (glyoxalase superfamily)